MLDIESLSGLEILQAIIRGDLPHPSIANVLPMEFVRAEKGRVIFEAIATEQHLNPMGGIHGGFASTVLDSVTGCAVHSMLGAGVPFATIELNIKMMRPIPRNTRLVAEGRLINLSRSLGSSEGTLTRIFHKLARMAVFPVSTGSFTSTLRRSSPITGKPPGQRPKIGR